MAGPSASRSAASPGKRTLTEQLTVQAKATAAEAPGPAAVHEAAQQGIAGPSVSLPHLDPIQRAFGRHDVSGVKAHVGGEATAAAHGMGAEAYATGDHVAFRDAPSLHLAAHEAAHVVQQRAGVHLAGGVGHEGDPHERHADEVADRVVQGKSAEDLLDTYHGGQGPASGSALQRKADTHYGEWFDDRYILTQTGTRRGVEMDLRFKPNASVDAELIGVTQTFRSTKAGSPYVLNNDPTRKDHSIKAGDAKPVSGGIGATDESAHIDQAEYNRNPMYAAEGAPASDTNLAQTLPDPDVTKKNTWGRHGFHYTDSSGTPKHQDALLFDTPNVGSADKSSEQVFESTAVAITGNQKDMYYGSVEWGWRTDAAGTFTKLPLKTISEGVPSSTFMKSAELWNKGKTSRGEDTLDLPMVDVKVTTATITQKPASDFIGPPLQIPAGTRVQIVTPATATAKGKIRVVDGTFTGQSLDIDAADMAAIKDERS